MGICDRARIAYNAPVLKAIFLPMRPKWVAQRRHAGFMQPVQETMMTTFITGGTSTSVGC